jgi:hypothetical protein
MSDSTDNVYEFTFTLTREFEQTVTVVGKDREKALQYATGILQAEQRGEPDVNIELTSESAKPTVKDYAVNTKRPVGDGGTRVYPYRNGY